MKNGFSALAITGFVFLNSAAYAEDPAPDPFLAPDPTGTSSVSEPAPALPKPETPESAGTVAPAPSQPAEQAPIAVSSLPGKTESSPASSQPKKDVYQEYEDYLGRVENRETDEDLMKMRSQFAHENGRWQLGLEYVHRAFGDYNFNFRPDTSSFQGTQPVFADTQGGLFSLGFFPLRSLDFGRLGLIAQGGVYLSKFTLETPQFNSSGQVTNMVRDDVKRQSAISYGARAVYEFQYFIGQLFVPFATVGVDVVRFSPYRVAGNATRNVVDIPANTVTAQSYGGGIHFNLNRVEPVVGSRALVNVGVKKFYLSYLALQRSGALSGLTHSLGLRFEF